MDTTLADVAQSYDSRVISRNFSFAVACPLEYHVLNRMENFLCVAPSLQRLEKVHAFFTRCSKLSQRLENKVLGMYPQPQLLFYSGKDLHGQQRMSAQIKE